MTRHRDEHHPGTWKDLSESSGVLVNDRG